MSRRRKSRAACVVAGADRRRTRQVADRPPGVERRPLVHGRQEAIGPVGRPLLRVAPRVGDRHVGRQVLVLGPQRVADPGADAGEPLEREARAHEHLAGPVSVRLRGQRVDEAHVIGAFGQVRQQVRKRLAALAPRPELPGAACEVAVLALERDQLLDPGHRLPVPLDQLGLVIPGVEVADRAGAEDVQHPLRPAGEVRRPGRHRVGRSSGRLRLPCPGIGREQPPLAQHRRQRDPADPGGHVAQEAAAVEQMAADEHGRSVRHGGSPRVSPRSPHDLLEQSRELAGPVRD